MNYAYTLEKRARMSPDLEAIYDVATDRRFTFRALDERCNRIANALLDAGIAKGDRVAILLMNGVEFCETFFAVARIGAICVPLNWRLTAEELAFVLRDCGASLLVYGTEFVDVARDLRATHATPEPVDVRAWWQVGGGAEGDAVEYDALLVSSSTTPPRVEAGGDDELFILYTSGTTGRPKGVVQTHEACAWCDFSMMATWESRYADRFLLALPLFHIGALGPMATNVHRGMTSVVLRSFDPSQVWRLIEEERITCMMAVPAMLLAMQAAPERATVDRSSLRWIKCVAAPVPVSTIETYHAQGILVLQAYGMTECCGPATITSAEEAVSKVGSAGRPFFHVEIRVVDSDGHDVAPGEAGEVWIGGPHVMNRYWNRPEATDEVLVDGWLRSGDLGSLDDDGALFIHDRIKDMIISGGENVYPAEVEDVILSHPDVSDVAVVGIPSERWGESGLAVVVRADPSLDGTGVLEHCRGRLARFKQPVEVVFVDEIPRNPSGKILKRLLRERFAPSAGG